jgi:hypothetical protein
MRATALSASSMLTPAWLYVMAERGGFRLGIFFFGGMGARENYYHTGAGGEILHPRRPSICRAQSSSRAGFY